MLRISIGTKKARLYTLAFPSNTAHSLCICHRTRIDFSYQNTFETLQADRDGEGRVSEGCVVGGGGGGGGDSVCVCVCCMVLVYT